MVAKTDDNVKLDMERLKEVFMGRTDNDQDFITCGSGTQHRNMKPLRSDRTHMKGNWSISKDQLDIEFHPDFFVVQVGLSLYNGTEVEQIEDSMITGVLREIFPQIRLETLQRGFMPLLWQNIFSHCPWLTLTKLSFFNDLVISKRRSRSNVQYVGSITSSGVWRFYICLHLEFILEHLEHFASEVVPSFVFDICSR